MKRACKFGVCSDPVTRVGKVISFFALEACNVIDWTHVSVMEYSRRCFCIRCTIRDKTFVLYVVQDVLRNVTAKRLSILRMICRN